MNISKFVPKSIDAVRLVFDVDKVYRKRNNLGVLALIYWCIWIKGGLASADRQENLDVIAMIFSRKQFTFTYILDLLAFFLFWFCCCKFYVSNLFRSVCIIKITICLKIFIWQAPCSKYIYFWPPQLLFFSLLSCALLLDHIPESHFKLQHYWMTSM